MMIDKLRKPVDSDACKKYREMEKEILPFLIKNSRRLSFTIPDIDYDDALQEGRIAIIVALDYASPEKNDGNVGPYVWRVVRNAYYGMAYEALTRSKVPYVTDTDEYGNSIKRPCFPLSLDTMIYTNDGVYQSFDPPDKRFIDPEKEEIYRKMRTEVGRFTMKMYNQLDGADYDVFKCKVHPTYEFLDMLYLDGVDFVHRNEEGMLVLSDDFNVTPEQIGRFLGLNKNAVGWSLYKIRKLFLEMARYDDDFIGLFDELVIDKRWPRIHMRKGKTEDIEFKRRIFKKRHLDSKQISPSEYAIGPEKDDNGNPVISRLIRWYGWGAVIVLKRNDEYYTIIAEGRFNPLTGAIFGSGISDAQEHIPMRWYRAIAKELKNE